MPDNIKVYPSPEGTAVDVATDVVAQTHYPIYKIAKGGDGEATLIDDEYKLPVEDYWLQHAIRRIFDGWGVNVSIYQKAKDLLKFGESQQVTTSKTTLMDLPSGVLNETFLTDNLITHFSSSNNGDTQSIVIEGHTIDGSGNFTFVVQTVTLVGQTKTPLTTPLARATRIYNNDSTDFAGDIYVYEDVAVVAGVPSTGTAVHCIATGTAGKNNSSKASTTISNVDFWILTSMTAFFLEKATGYAEVHLEIRYKGKVFREFAHAAVNNGSPVAQVTFKPYIIVPSNADIRLVAVADGASTYVGGSLDGLLAIVV